MTPLVSVIVPVVEAHRKYLPYALESIERQSYVHHETIVVDGTLGTAQARNEGVRQANADLITFLDADDWLINIALEVLLDGYASSADCAYAYGDWYILNQQSTRYRYERAQVYDRDHQLKKNLHIVTTVIEKKAIEAINGFDESFQAWEDWDFYTRLGLAGYCGHYVNAPTLIYRRSSSINRIKHDAIGHDIHQQLLSTKYHDYIQGITSFMPCSCSQSKPKPNLGQSAQRTVQMEFMGNQQAPLRFMLRDRTEVMGANNNTNRYAWVTEAHATELLERFARLWKEVRRVSQVPKIPQPYEMAQQGQ